LRRLLLEARGDSKESCGIGETLACGLMRQSLLALAYVHFKKVIHRDIKPANMLLSSPPAEKEQPHLLLADFGIAEIFELKQGKARSNTVKGTAAYLAPETFERPPGPRADVWATGIVSFELLCGQRPFKIDNLPALYMKLKRTDICYDPLHNAGASKEAVSFVRSLLTRTEADRPTADRALEEPWLSDDATWKPASRTSRRMIQSLTNYSSMSAFVKVAINCVAAQIDAGQLDDIDAAFKAIDVNHDGELSLDELSAGLKALGVDPCSAGQLADALDVNHDGTIQYSEFVTSLMASQHELAENNLRHAFDIFDVDHNGSISLDELRLMLSSGGALASVLPDGKTADAVLKEVDTSGDGVISFIEFRNYILQEAPGSATTSQRRASVPAFPKETIDSVLRQLSVEAGHAEDEGAACARKLADEHYLVTMADVADLSSDDWARLELPLKLERLLRACCISS